MFYYPLMTASVGITINLFFLLVITIFSWYKFGPEAKPSEDHVPLVKTHISWDESKKPLKMCPKERAGRESKTADPPCSGFKSEVRKLTPETISRAGDESFEVLHGREDEPSKEGIRKRTAADSKESSIGQSP